MRTLVFLLLSATSWGQEKSAAVDPRLKRLDDELVRVGAEAGEALKLADGVAQSLAALKTQSGGQGGDLSAESRRQLNEACAEKFDLAEYAKTAQADASFASLRKFHECTAFAERKPETCRLLTTYKLKTPQPEAEPVCRATFRQRSLAEINITRRPDAVAACEKLDFEPEAIQEAGGKTQLCKFEVHPGGARAACQQGLATLHRKISDEEMKECVATQGATYGDASACAMLPAGPPKEECQDMALYRKAYGAKNIDACGGSITCRLMMGGGARVCREHLRGVIKEYCRDWAQENSKAHISMLEEQRRLAGQKSAEMMEKLIERRTQVDVQLVALGNELQGFEPKTLAGFQTRVARYKDIRRKFDEGMARVGRLTGPPSKSAGQPQPQQPRNGP